MSALPFISPLPKDLGRAGEGFTFKQKKLSSLVQRQSERQGIFPIDLSPLERGAGGVKYRPYILPLKTQGELERVSFILK